MTGSASAKKIAIIGAGNIGTSIARGLAKSGQFQPAQIMLTRRHVEQLAEYKKHGFVTSSDNQKAIKDSELVILAIEPQQARPVLENVVPVLDPDQHILMSVVSGLSIRQIKEVINKSVDIVRVMPNTAISIGESMTCLAAEDRNTPALKIARAIFDTVGTTIVIDEEQMSAATSLGACGIAFFLRAIRAASQGGIEIGFHAEQALQIAAQTAKGAASLIKAFGNHPEQEIDRVTTPRGCTIAGLNQMEHDGFSSALIKGIRLSASKAAELYREDG